MITRKGRKRVRTIKRLSTGLSILLFAGWFLSVPTPMGHGMVGYCSAKFAYIELCYGSVHWALPHVVSGTAAKPPPLGLSFKWEKIKPKVSTLEWTYGIRLPSVMSRYGSIPLWVPFLLSIAATILIWYLERRSNLSPNHCKTCHYNLTGNSSGICPECGTPIENPAPSP